MSASQLSYTGIIGAKRHITMVVSTDVLTAALKLTAQPDCVGFCRTD